MRYRMLRDADLPAEMIAMHDGDYRTGLTVEADNGIVLGCGGLWWSNGICWAFFDVCDHARNPFLVHRLAKEFMESARSAGVTEMFTTCDDAKPRAEAWLVRLGFRKLKADEWPELIKAVKDQFNDLGVWKCHLQP